MIPRETVTSRDIFYFWRPLALTWLMMAVEGPLLTALIARLADEKFNLAAYGVSYSILLICEAPILMMISASLALAQHKEIFQKLRRFAYVNGAIMSCVLLAIACTPLFDLVTKRLMDLEEPVRELMKVCLLIFVPCPFAVGYRRLYQGILVRTRHTKLVAMGTVVRVTTMALSGYCFFRYSGYTGATVGALGLSAGMLCEAVVSRIMAAPHLKALQDADPDKGHTHMSYPEIARFYYPLAITTVINLAVHPLVVLFLSHSSFSIESLAVMPIVNAFVLLFKSAGIAFQEVVISFLDRSAENLSELRRFALLLAGTVFSLFLLIVLTPLIQVWFRQVSGLSEELAEFAVLPTRILSVMPALTVWLSFQRGRCVVSKHTTAVTLAGIVEIIVIGLTLFAGISILDLSGAVAVAISFVAGGISGNLWLISTKSAQNGPIKTAQIVKLAAK